MTMVLRFISHWSRQSEHLFRECVAHSVTTWFTEANRKLLAGAGTYVSQEVPTDLSSAPMGFRIATMQNSIVAEGEKVTLEQVWRTFYPALIFCIVLVGIASIFLPVSIYLCAKIHPALAKGYVERPTRWYSPFSFRRLLLPILLILLFVGVAVWSLLFVFHGNIEFTQNLNIATEAGQDLFWLASATLNGVGPVAGFMLMELNKTIAAAVECLYQDINTQSVTYGVQADVQAVEGHLEASQTSMARTNGNVTSLQSASDQQVAAYLAILPVAGNWTANARKIDQMMEFPDGDGTYSIQPPISIPDRAVSDLPPVRNTTRALLELLGTGTSGLAGTLDAAAAVFASYDPSNFAASVDSALNASIMAAQSLLVPRAQEEIDNLVAVYEQNVRPVADTLDGAAAQFDNLVTFLAKIDMGRNVLTAIAGALSALALLIVVIAVLARSPHWAGHCMLAVLALGIISLLVGALYLAISVAIGATCSAIEKDNLQALVPTINQIAGTNLLPAHVQAFNLAQEECAAGANGLRVVVDIIEMLQKAGVQISIDPTMISTVNNALDRIKQFSTDNQTIDAAINAALDRLPAQINAGIDAALSGIQGARRSIELALSQATRPLLAQASVDPYTPEQAAAVAVLAQLGVAGAAAGRVQTSIASRLAEAQTLVETEAARLSSSWNAIDANEGTALKNSQGDVIRFIEGSDASLAQFNEDMASLETALSLLANGTLALVEAEIRNFSANGLSTAEQTLMAFANDSVKLVRALTSCTAIIQDTYVIQNAVCLGVQRATDELWFGFVLQGFVWTLGVLSMLYAVRLVWDTDDAWRWRGRRVPMEPELAEKYALSPKQEFENVRRDSGPKVVDSDLGTFCAVLVPMPMERRNDVRFSELPLDSDTSDAGPLPTPMKS